MSDGECPNCSAAIKGGFRGNALRSEDEVLFVNALAGTSLTGACEKCYSGLHANAQRTFKERLFESREALKNASLMMPVASIHAPPGWDFEVVGLVTAQSVTGTGVFSDITSAFTDLFGAQSGSYNQKLRAGEDLCKASLRIQALEQSANAILGVDVDYAEVGGQRAMLMVCMTGTAVRITNPEAVTPDFAKNLSDLADLHADLLALLNIGRTYRVT